MHSSQHRSTYIKAVLQGTWLAVGQWVTNDILLHPLGVGFTSLRLPLPVEGQARSFALARIGEPFQLFAGTSEGNVVVWQLACTPGADLRIAGSMTARAGASLYLPSSFKLSSSASVVDQPQAHISLQHFAQHRINPISLDRSTNNAMCLSYAGLAAVDLELVPGSPDAPEHVYARSDQSLIFRAKHGLLHTGALGMSSVMFYCGLGR